MPRNSTDVNPIFVTGRVNNEISDINLVGKTKELTADTPDPDSCLTWS